MVHVSRKKKKKKKKRKRKKKGKKSLKHVGRKAAFSCQPSKGDPFNLLFDPNAFSSVSSLRFAQAPRQSDAQSRGRKNKHADVSTS